MPSCRRAGLVALTGCGGEHVIDDVVGVGQRVQAADVLEEVVEVGMDELIDCCHKRVMIMVGGNPAVLSDATDDTRIADVHHLKNATLSPMLTVADAETAIRNYLLYLDDPSQLIDPEEIHRLQAEIDAATDPLDKLRILSKMQRAQQTDEHVLRAAFCAHAKAWADANDVTAASLATLGVGADVLRTAGFDSSRSASPGPARTRTRTVRGAGGRAVTTAQVKADIARRTSPFTLADVADRAGGSPMTIRKAVYELIAAGTVERLGPSTNWTRPGRAPIVFRTVANRHQPTRVDDAT